MTCSFVYATEEPFPVLGAAAGAKTTFQWCRTGDSPGECLADEVHKKRRAALAFRASSDWIDAKPGRSLVPPSSSQDPV